MSHQLDPNDIPWPELPKPGEFFNSVWSPENVRPSERALTRFIVWLGFAGAVGLSILMLFYIGGTP